MGRMEQRKGDAPMEEWSVFLGISQSTGGLMGLCFLMIFAMSEEVAEVVRAFFLWRGGEPFEGWVLVEREEREDSARSMDICRDDLLLVTEGERVF